MDVRNSTCLLRSEGETSTFVSAANTVRGDEKRIQAAKRNRIMGGSETSKAPAWARYVSRASFKGVKSTFAGPFRTFPSGLNREPWQGQSQLFSLEFQRTTQPRCGQTALQACISPFSSR